MKLKSLILLITFLTCMMDMSFTQNFQQQYISKTIILKIKPEYRDKCTKESINIETLSNYLNEINVEQVTKKFPHTQPPAQSINKNGYKPIDLSLIYELQYQAEISLDNVINNLKRFDFIEYAEPHYLQRPLSGCPTNDPYINMYQQYLPVIRADNAWCISQGDTNVVIGIVDVGFDIDHVDLINNIKYNYSDPIDGYDNDNDGFTDNYHGWDLTDNDNNPQIDNTNNHGTAVAGISSASTNNGNYMAGVGFKCKFLPVKVANAEGIITHGYEGIIYAAEHGCSVILCPWGSEIYQGQFGQDVINFVTESLNALVIAPAGNDSIEVPYYPASYEHVLSVAATNNSNIKWAGSNYGCGVDICAPGVSISSLKNGGWSASNYTGTSFSSAMVAGGAGLLRGYFPNYNAIQIGEQLKVTADKIDALNPAYAGKLGSGRLNLYNALTNTSLPSIILSDIYITDNDDNIFNAGDNIFVWASVTNYLAPTHNLQIKVSESSPYITIQINPIVSFGVLQTLETDNTTWASNWTMLKVSADLPSCQNETVCLNFIIYDLDGTDTTYIATQCSNINLTLEMIYVNIDTNKVGTTIVSDGRVGYYLYPDEGLGFTFEGSPSILREAGLMVGNSSSVVADNIADTDFVCIKPVAKIIPPIESDFDVIGIFNDDSAGTEQLNLSVTQYAYAFADSGYDKFVIFEYHIFNTGAATLNNLFAGMFADWDVGASTHNTAEYDDINKLGYIYSTDGDGYGGIKLLNVSNPSLINYYAIEGVQTPGCIDITDGFSTQDKFVTLSTDRPAAGYNGTGNNVRHVLSTGPYTLSPNDSLVVAFTFTAGDHLLELQQNAVNAQVKYNQMISIPENNQTFGQIQIYPNPFSTSATIKMENGKWKMENCEFVLYDLLGREMKINVIRNLDSFVISSCNLNAGVYSVKIITEEKIYNKKIVVLK